MDVAPDIDSVELSVRVALSGKKGIQVRRESDVIEILARKRIEPIATIEWARDSPTLYISPWHGHFESGEELTHALLMLLGGCASIVEEFKGSERTALFRFSFDGVGWLIDNVSFYIDPHQPEEWRLKDGQQWSWLSTTQKTIDASADFRARFAEGRLDRRGLPPRLRLGKRRITVKKPVIWRLDDCFAWYERRFGPPLPGLRWTESNSERFIYQVPSPWTEVEIDVEGFVSGYRSPDSVCEILVRTWTRDTEGRDQDFKTSERVRYKTCEIHERTVDQDGIKWAENLWEMTFANGEEDQLAWFTLRHQSAEPEKDDYLLLKSRLDEALKLALFSPPQDGTRGTVTWSPG